MAWYRLQGGTVVEMFGDNGPTDENGNPRFHPDLIPTILELPDGGAFGDVWDGEQFITPESKSKLEGGSREPNVVELEANPVAALAYLEGQLASYVNAEIARRRYESVGAVALYAAGGSRFAAECRALLAWRESVYELAEDLELALLDPDDPQGMITWSDLLAQLPTPPADRVRG